MSIKQKGIIKFACGATMPVNDGEGMCGKKIVTLTIPAQSHQRPTLNGEPAPCLFGCPARVKDSGRKAIRGWHEDGSKGWLVKCKIVGTALNSESERAAGVDLKYNREVN